MNIMSDKRKRVGTTQISDGIINTYTFDQESGQPVADIRIETTKSGVKVLGADYMGTSNRLLIDISDYKFVSQAEKKAALSAMVDDIENILTEKSE